MLLSDRCYATYLADLAVDASADYAIGQMAERVIHALQSRPDVLTDKPEEVE